MSITPVLPVDSPGALEECVRCINHNGVIVIPTDTVYGIGCSAFQSQPIERIFMVKGRDSNKAIPILIGGFEQINQVARSLNNKAETLMHLFWPGPLTIIVPRNPSLPVNLSPYDTIGIRMPNHTWLLSVLLKSGPLAVTSANPSGKPEAKNVDEVIQSLDGKIDLIVNGGQSASAKPSTVVDCTGAEIRILREGPILSADILKALS